MHLNVARTTGRTLSNGIIMQYRSILNERKPQFTCGHWRDTPCRNNTLPFTSTAHTAIYSSSESFGSIWIETSCTLIGGVTWIHGPVVVSLHLLEQGNMLCIRPWRTTQLVARGPAGITPNPRVMSSNPVRTSVFLEKFVCRIHWVLYFPLKGKLWKSGIARHPLYPLRLFLYFSSRKFLNFHTFSSFPYSYVF